MSLVVKKQFFAWNEDAEKAFLEDMALKGYRLSQVQLGKYTFEEDTPKKVVYQFDFNALHGNQEAEYLQMYEDAGWKCMFRYASWYYFAKEITDQTKDIDLSIFSDNRSKMAKYRRLILFLVVTGLPLYYQALILFPTLNLMDPSLPKFYTFFRVVITAFTALHLFALARIVLVYRKLQDHVRE